jgi:hypothetical protein
LTHIQHAIDTVDKKNLMVHFSYSTTAVALCLALQSRVAEAWAPSFSRTGSLARTHLGASKESWSVVDDWSTLSSEHPENVPDSGTLFNKDPVTDAVREFEAAGGPALELSEEELWIHDIVDEIYNDFSTLDSNEAPLYDTGFDESKTKVNYLDDMGKEIAMLVRCNEHPEELLISEGRAVPPLAQEEKDDVSQLVTLTKDECRVTDFMKDSVSRIFHLYAKPDKLDGVLCMQRPEVAKWMTRSLKEEYPTGTHDSRVLRTISDFGSYRSGRLVEEDLQRLYLSVIIGDTTKLSASNSPKRHLQLRHPFVQSVWRDIRNHGILAPIEEERKRLAEKITAKTNNISGVNPLGQVQSMEMELLDECEILDWDYRPDDIEEPAKREASGDRSSHKTLDLVPNTKTPLAVRDGDFGKFLNFQGQCKSLSSQRPSNQVRHSVHRRGVVYWMHAGKLLMWLVMYILILFYNHPTLSPFFYTSVQMLRRIHS